MTNYGEFESPRPSDLEVFNGIAVRFETAVGKEDGWENLQKTIVNFQENAGIIGRNIIVARKS